MHEVVTQAADPQKYHDVITLLEGLIDEAAVFYNLSSTVVGQVKTNLVQKLDTSSPKEKEEVGICVVCTTERGMVRITKALWKMPL